MLLTPIGTHKHFGASLGKTEKTSIVYVRHTLIDQVQVHFMASLYSLCAECRYRRRTWMGRWCG